MRVAMINNGITSTVNASLEIARRLTTAGHSVTVLCHRDIGATVQANGHGFVQLVADAEAFGELKDVLRGVRRGSWRDRVTSASRLLPTARRVRRQTASGHELHTLIDGLSPDIVLIDIEAHLAVVTSARWPMPVALTTFLFAIDPRPGVPPIDSRLGPDDQHAIDAAWSAAFTANRVARRRRSWSKVGAVDRFGPISYSTASRTALRAVARRSGFGLRRSTSVKQWLRPHGYRRLPVLTTNMRELEFGSGAPESWHYVGPMVDADRRETAADSVSLQRWVAVRDRHRQQPDRPLIYCSLGSYWTSDTRLLKQVIAAFAVRPDWDLVIGLGRRGTAVQLGDLPANVTALTGHRRRPSWRRLMLRSSMAAMPA